MAPLRGGVRMPKPNRVAIRREVQERLRQVAAHSSLLPMPYHCDGSRISAAEWEEYHQRAALYHKAMPHIRRMVGRPSIKTAEAVWNLLSPYMADMQEKFDHLITNGYGWLTEDEKNELEVIAKQALLIVLHTFIVAGEAHKNVTYNMLFDALCRKFSDHHRCSLASSVRDMRKETVWMCQRDLLRNGIDPHKYWRLTLNWSQASTGHNPLFSIEKKAYSGKGQVIRVIPIESAVRTEIENILSKDTQYVSPHIKGIRACFINTELPRRPIKYEMCAEAPYNLVPLGEKSDKLLRLQSEACLWFDTGAFNKDYREAKQERDEFARRMLDEFGLDVYISDTKRQVRDDEAKRFKEIWSKREKEAYFISVKIGLRQKQFDPQIEPTVHDELSDTQKKAKWVKRHADLKSELQECKDDSIDILHLSVEDVVRAAISTRQLRRDIRQLLTQFDRAQRHVNEYKRVYEQVREMDGPHLIHSAFDRVINRRYQPVHLWPSYVTSKSGTLPEDEMGPVPNNENKLESYRKRWFKARDPETGEPIHFVSRDISSSQTQIIATLLGIEKLEELTMGDSGKSFKETMADWAWQEFGNPVSDSVPPERSHLFGKYSGPNDPRLQELCKTLWMRVSYGGSAYSVVEEQRRDIKTYGPGWTTKVAQQFLDKLYVEFPEIKAFLAACRRIGEITYNKDCYSGVTFTDPSDGVIICWNPVERYNTKTSNNGRKLSISLPGKYVSEEWELDPEFQEAKPNTDGEYPVNLHQLKKMIAPCLVHVLDSFYSTLVMEKLAERGITDFVGIHDCWMIPQRVSVSGKICSGLEVLHEVMDETAAEWYAGLGPVYQDLIRYLGDDPKYKDLVWNAYNKWKERVAKGHPIKFKAKDTAV